MNKLLRAFLFAGAFLLASLSVSHAEAAAKYGDKILEKGSEGPEVATLQQDLRILGYFTAPSNTGYYGDITESAVKAFQKDYGIQQTGKVGSTTAPIIAEAAAKKQQELQKALADNAILVETAKKMVGVPYVWGGSSPAGFDCSGFARYVYAQKGIQLPRTSFDMFAQGNAVSELRPGDLVFFSTYARGASHVGIYLGDNQFVSADSTYGIKIDSLSSSYWGPRYIGARRY